MWLDAALRGVDIPVDDGVGTCRFGTRIDYMLEHQGRAPDEGRAWQAQRIFRVRGFDEHFMVTDHHMLVTEFELRGR